MNDRELAQGVWIINAIMLVMYYLGYAGGMYHQEQKAARRLQQAQRRINKGIRRNRR